MKKKVSKYRRKTKYRQNLGQKDSGKNPVSQQIGQLYASKKLGDRRESKSILVRLINSLNFLPTRSAASYFNQTGYLPSLHFDYLAQGTIHIIRKHLWGSKICNFCLFSVHKHAYLRKEGGCPKSRKMCLRNI